MDNNLTFINACRNGQKSIVQIFLQKGGIDVNKRDVDGNTALHYAYLKGYRDIVAQLLDCNTDANIVNNRTETPLHAAAQSGNKEIIGLLLDKGANMNATNREGRTPLICLLENKRNDAALYLMDKGADTELTDSTGHKAIDYATAYGLRDVVARLINAETKDSRGNTPLHQAVYNEQAEIIRTLLSAPDLMLNATNDYDETPLIIASMNGNLLIAKLLIDAGADVNRTDNKQHTALYHASERGFNEIVETLLAAGAQG